MFNAISYCPNVVIIYFILAWNFIISYFVYDAGQEISN